jgi:hypothetical protein
VGINRLDLLLGSYNRQPFSTGSTRCSKVPYNIGKSSHTSLRLESVSSRYEHYAYATLEPYECKAAKV